MAKSICCFLVCSVTFSLAASLSADMATAAEPDQIALLKTFRQEFVPLTPGQDNFPASFQMGRADGGSDSERPVHEVTLTTPFQIARYEVPQNLWEAVMGENPSKWKGPRNSVEMLSYGEAVKFCQQVTTLLREQKLIGADELVRLPSEAEWEYAARAGTTTVYSFGDDAKPLGDYGWFHGNAKGNDPPVGALKPNAWKLYDMHGYLWEWCSDAWHENYDGAPADGTLWVPKDQEEKLRVVRGGSWKDAAELLTSTSRRPANESVRDDAIGLRCVLAKQPKE